MEATPATCHSCTEAEASETGDDFKTIWPLSVRHVAVTYF